MLPLALMHNTDKTDGNILNYSINEALTKIERQQDWLKEKHREQESSLYNNLTEKALIAVSDRHLIFGQHFKYLGSYVFFCPCDDYKTTTSKSPFSHQCNAFPMEGWMMMDPQIICTMSARVRDILGFKEYYFKTEQVLYTCTLSTTAVSKMINDGGSPPESTKLNDDTSHNCKMLRTGSHPGWSSFLRVVTFRNSTSV